MDDFTIKYVDLINQQHVVSTGKQTYGFHNPKWRTEMVTEQRNDMSKTKMGSWTAPFYQVLAPPSLMMFSIFIKKI
jgi:hypothetical protein